MTCVARRRVAGPSRTPLRLLGARWGPPWNHPRPLDLSRVRLGSPMGLSQSPDGVHEGQCKHISDGLGLRLWGPICVIPWMPSRSSKGPQSRPLVQS
eukprot:5837014-Pyramimonas_sp.AAC.2